MEGGEEGKRGVALEEEKNHEEESGDLKLVVVQIQWTVIDIWLSLTQQDLETPDEQVVVHELPTQGGQVAR